MIPKILHYCWFGKGQKAELFQKCLDSWQKSCPDYQIIEWNEANFDISSCPLYVRQAYDARKWAFVTDYVRLRIVYEHGGIYLDTDVEVKKNFDRFLQYSAFFGLENDKSINTGIGFGGEAKAPILFDLMRDYENISFVTEDGSFDLTPCPVRNTAVFLKYGFLEKDKKQVLQTNILVLPSVYMCPLDYETGQMRKSRKTVAIHWFDASWASAEKKEKHQKWIEQQKIISKYNKREKIKGIPKRLLRCVLGKRLYAKVKNKLRR